MTKANIKTYQKESKKIEDSMMNYEITEKEANRQLKELMNKLK